MFNDLSSPLSMLETRRSGKPRDMIAPGPSPEELSRILETAIRVPDHGKLAPWRFVVIEDRDAFAALIARAYTVERENPGKVEVKANADFARQAPVLIVAISAPVTTSKIPVREQRLSMGAAIFNLELIAIAMGYVAGWLTGWAAYSQVVLEELGGAEGEEIAGFLFIGKPARPLDERPRPDLEKVVVHWPKHS